MPQLTIVFNKEICYFDWSMTIEEFQISVSELTKKLPDSDFDMISDDVITEIEALCNEADNLEMKSGKNLLSNLEDTIKTRKAGKKSDESVQVRLTALDFYLQNLQNGSTEEI